ncbi:unnamed protein product [Closterium sp. NIES-65]|nr:unnamed protein product [Closterium sp. NIES-65]
MADCLPHDQGLTGSFCSNISLLTSLTKIDLANNSLSGSLPTSLGNLTRLDTLCKVEEGEGGGEGAWGGWKGGLESGIVPPTLGNFTRVSTLSRAILHSQADQLHPVLPFSSSILSLSFFTLLSLSRPASVLDGSRLICPTGAGQSCTVKQTSSTQFCQTCSEFCSTCTPVPDAPSTAPAPSSPSPPSPPPPPPPASSGLPVGAIVGIALGGALAAALLAGGIFFFCRRNSTAGASYCWSLTSSSLTSSSPTSSFLPHLFLPHFLLLLLPPLLCLWELSLGLLLGGVLAAALLAIAVEEMASKSHPHLVRLLGYCVDIDRATDHHEQIVIYEFCPNGDLEKYLSEVPHRSVLTETSTSTFVKPKVSDFGLLRCDDA